MITVQEFQDFESLPQEQRIDVINKMKNAVELANLDLQHIIGRNLYFQVLQNINTPEYQEFFNGSMFQYQDINYTHPGIKKILSKLAYSRYVYDINTNHTPFGLQERLGENSQAVNFNKIREISKQAQSDASEMWELSKLYLENSSLPKVQTKPNKTDSFGQFNYQLL